ncbi:MAG: hypothetical protein ABGW50_00140, partial [Thermococcus sp.]
MVELLRENIGGRGIANVEIILSEKPPELPERPNLVAFSLSLHEVGDWRGYLRWASRADYVLVIEWCPESEHGPPRGENIPREELIELDGFEVVLSRVRFLYYLVILGPVRRG